MKLIKKQRTYKNKKGEEKKTYDFYLKIEGLEQLIPIEPKHFGEKFDNYKLLASLATYEK